MTLFFQCTYDTRDFDFFSSGVPFSLYCSNSFILLSYKLFHSSQLANFVWGADHIGGVLGMISE